MTDGTHEDESAEAALEPFAMQGNQYWFEVIRDLATMISRVEPGDSIDISVKRSGGPNNDLLSWGSSSGTTCGCSEAARRMSDAYHNKSA